MVTPHKSTQERRVASMTRINMIAAIVCGLIAITASIEAQEVDKAGQPVISRTVTIGEAVDVALRNNPTIAARKAGLAAASARVGMAKAMTRPQVSTSTFATTSSEPMILPGPDPVQPQNFTLTPNEARLSQNLMAMYPLYTGGRIKSQVGSALALREASSFEAKSSELDVALAVKSAYYRVLLARQFVDAYQERVTEARERVRIAQEAFDAGRIAKYDLLRNQAELAEAEQELNNAQRDVDVALIDLKSMMGISQSSEITLSDTLTFQEESPNVEELQAKAISQRPEVAAARARVRSAQANVDAAKSSYKPQVYATAMVDAGVMSGNGLDDAYLLGVAAALPIFDGGARKSAVNEAQAMVQQMQADERESVLNVNRDVAAGVATQSAAAKNVTLSQAAIAQAEEDYRVIRLRYEAGRATNVEVLDALASLTRARTNYAEALYSHSIARETLARAIGQR